MNKNIIIAIIAAAIAIPVVAYTASALFFNTTINESLPAMSGGSGAQEPETGAPAQEPESKPTESEVMTKPSGDAEVMVKDDAGISDSTSNDAMTKELSGAFAGAGDGFHNAEGTARVIYLEDGSVVLRFEDFKVTNGPDLYVYLSADKGASDYVSLGRLKANIGNQNYQLPDGVDLTKYDTVIVWCQAFSVYFGGAELRSP